MNFFRTLLRPDREEDEMADRMIVVEAANLLQVGEFQLLQLAYREWYGRDLPTGMVDRLFATYMLHNEVPHWARHYARLVLTRQQQGIIDCGDARYHVYDHDYRTWVPNGARKFWLAVGFLAVSLFVCILIAETSVQTPTSRLPPYFNREELRPPAPDARLAPRATEIEADRR